MSYSSNKTHRERIDKKLEKIASIRANDYEYNVDKYPKPKRQALLDGNKIAVDKIEALKEAILDIDPSF